MSRSLMLRVVLGVVAIVVSVAALVLIPVTRGGDSGEPVAATSASPTATARATVITPARTAEPAYPQTNQMRCFAESASRVQTNLGGLLTTRRYPA